MAKKIVKKLLQLAYDYKVNDVFKIWCANMVKQKAKYLILQHGGNFGSSEYEIEEDIQKELAHTFFHGDGKIKYTKMLNHLRWIFRFILQKKIRS